MKFRLLTIHILSISAFNIINLVLFVNSADIIDPLQPIWNTINHLSEKILGNLQSHMDISAEEFTSAMETKTINGQDPNLVITSSPNPENSMEMTQIKEAVSTFLSGTFPDLYDSHIRRNEESVSGKFQSIKTHLSDMELKIVRHLDQTMGKGDFLFHFSDDLEQQISVVQDNAAVIRDTARGADERFKKIKKEMPKTEEGTCSDKNSEILQFIYDSSPSRQRLDAFEREWLSTYQAIVESSDSKSFYRDCSDILWINPNSTSGVYSIYPTRNMKREVRVWCDMTTADNEGSVGGWTVVLRRRNTSLGLLNFNRTWQEYSTGFGEAGDEGEWWLGLEWMHQLTYQQPYEVSFLMHDVERGYFQAYYSTFRIEDESRNYRLVVDGFSGNVSDAFKDKHHGMQFTTFDRDNDNCDSCNCATNNQGGWWFNVCHWTSLTNPFPTSNDRSAKTIRWLSGVWLVLDDVTIMIRPANFRPRQVTGLA